MSGKYIQTKIWKAVALASVMSTGLILASCGGDDGGSAKTVKPSYISVNANPSRRGFQLSYRGVGVGKTNQAGYSRSKGLVPSDRALFTLADAFYGFAPQFFTVDLKEGDNIDFGLVNLIDLSKKSQSFEFVNGIDFQDTSGAAAKINANAFENISSITTKPLLYLIEINPTDKTKKLLPSDWKTNTGENKGLVSLEPLSAIYIDAAYEKKNESFITNVPLGTNLKKDESVSVTLPIPTANTAELPNSVGLYYFDFTDGLWKVEGDLTLSVDKKSYTGTTRRLGYYLAAMKPVNETVTLTGCVENFTVDAATKNKTYKKLPRTLIKLTGQSYNGYDQVVTDADGNFSITAKKGSNIELIFRKGQFTSKQSVNAVNANMKVVGSADSQNGCIVLDTTGVDTNALSGKLTWSGSQDYDVNIMVPQGNIIFPGKSQLFSSSGLALQTKEAKNEETLAYTALQEGIHLIAVNNFNSVYDPSMSSETASTTLRLTDNTQKETIFKAADISGEVTQRDSQLVDRRSNVWLAATMTVKMTDRVSKTCEARLSVPTTETVTRTGNALGQPDTTETIEYKQWMTDTEFAAGKVFVDDKVTLSEAQSSLSEYCTSVTFQ